MKIRKRTAVDELDLVIVQERCFDAESVDIKECMKIFKDLSAIQATAYVLFEWCCPDSKKRKHSNKLAEAWTPPANQVNSSSAGEYSDWSADNIVVSESSTGEHSMWSAIPTSESSSGVGKETCMSSDGESFERLTTPSSEVSHDSDKKSNTNGPPVFAASSIVLQNWTVHLVKKLLRPFFRNDHISSDTYSRILRQVVTKVQEKRVYDERNITVMTKNYLKFYNVV